MWDEKLLFKVAGSPVMFWGSYGAVCPSLWTTNGNIRFLSRCVSEYAKMGKAITDVAIPSVDFTDEEALAAVLLTEWRRWDEEMRRELG